MIRLRRAPRAERRLDGQVAIVTGASSGIGAATARRLARAGARVVATARREERLARLVAEIEAAGGHARGAPGDITSPEDRARVVEETLAAFGRIDALVNNAGYGQRGPVELVPVESIRRNFETNVFSLVGLTQLIIPHMREAGRGTIVNVSSVAGRITWPLSAVYGATKHALEALSDGLRGELAPFGIRVVVIQPGFITTEFQEAAIAASGPVLDRPGPYAVRLESAEKRFARARRLAGRPEEVAELILEAIAAERPRARYAVPLHARAALIARRLLPDGAVDRLMARR